MEPDTRAQQYASIARASGAFSMVAIDARESMRAILRDAGVAHDDDHLGAFKTLVAEELAGLASGVLCDPLHGRASMAAVRATPSAPGLIVAVDHFDEPRFGPLAESSLHDDAMTTAVQQESVSALKLYLYWRPDATPHFREDDARRFVERCRELNVLSLLEGVVTAPGDSPEFNASLVRAAESMGRIGPDIYKTQVPSWGRVPDAVIERESRNVSDAAGVPWVVLSNGVPDDRFLDATAAACRGGASGVLAGRAIWRESLRAPDVRVDIALRGRERLRAINAVVDQYARPWYAAID